MIDLIMFLFFLIVKMCSIVVLIIILLITRWYYWKKLGRVFYIMRSLPGPRPYIIVGNIPLMTKGALMSVPIDLPIKSVQMAFGLGKLYAKEGMFLIWLGFQPIVVAFSPQITQALLSSATHIDKAINYKYLHPWLGTGLLTSNGDKWRKRRKLLTPSFHFHIIETFIPIMNAESTRLVEKINEKYGEISDMTQMVTYCTLDIICETAMGVNMSAQSNPTSEYCESVAYVGESFTYRNLNISAWIDWIFYKTEAGRKYKESLCLLHGFTNKVIRDRKRQIKKQMEIKEKENSKNCAKNDLEDNILGIKKRKAFLDLLLEQHLLSDGKQITEEEIREEVDTFMFEGHDTTAMGITWSLYLIGLNENSTIQAKIDQELDEIFGDDKERAITSEDTTKMKYLECCIKESQRLFPSVPFIARQLTSDGKFGDYYLPSGATIMLNIMLLHRNEDIFPNPEVYMPERFMNDEGLKRHPYAYVPFSAGQRNCIGQKFALMEEKIVLANLMRHFTFKSLDERDQILIQFGLVTRPQNKLRMLFQKR